MFFIKSRKLPSIPGFLRVFFKNHEWVLDFVKCSPVSIDMVISFFLCSLLTLWIFNVACCIFIFVLFCRLEVPVDLTGFAVQDVSLTGLLSRGSVDESPSKLIQVFGRIQFLEGICLKSPFPCWLSARCPLCS